MDKVPADNPVSIRATIRGSIGTDQALQKEIAAEAGQALKDLRDTGANTNGCIGADESYMLLKSTKDLGKIEVLVKDKIVNVQYYDPAANNFTCQDLNVTSNIRESVNLAARKETNFEGLTGEPFFMKKPEIDNERPTVPIAALTADKLDQKTNRFVGTVLLCVKGNSQFAQAQGKKIIVEAKRTEGQDKVPKNDRLSSLRKQKQTHSSPQRITSTIMRHLSGKAALTRFCGVILQSLEKRRIG